MLDDLDDLIGDVARELTAKAAPADFERRVMARLGDARARSPRHWPYLAGLAAAAALIVVVALGRSPAKRMDDMPPLEARSIAAPALVLVPDDRSTAVGSAGPAPGVRRVITPSSARLGAAVPQEAVIDALRIAPIPVPPLTVAALASPDP